MAQITNHDTPEQAQAAKTADPLCQLCPCTIDPEQRCQPILKRFIVDSSSSFRNLPPDTEHRRRTQQIDVWKRETARQFKDTVHSWQTLSAITGKNNPYSHIASALKEIDSTLPVHPGTESFRRLVVLITDGMDTLESDCGKSTLLKTRVMRIQKAAKDLLSHHPDVRLLFAMAAPASKTLGCDPVDAWRKTPAGISGIPDVCNSQSSSQHIDRCFAHLIDDGFKLLEPALAPCNRDHVQGVACLHGNGVDRAAVEDERDYPSVVLYRRALNKVIEHAGVCSEAQEPLRGSYTLTRKPPPMVFEDVVALGGRRGFNCSGVLLNQHTVLTARHCLPVLWAKQGSSVMAKRPKLTVADSAAHPLRSHDIALLRLHDSARGPFNTWRRQQDDHPPATVLRHVGFGATDASGMLGFGRKRMRDVPANGWGCDGRRPLSSGCIPGVDLVLSGSAGRDTCVGDSGGPVYELIGDGTECHWRLVAVTSRRIANARVRCGAGGIYTRVDAAEPWISRTMKGWGI